jgi:hypothetical protein
MFIINDMSKVVFVVDPNTGKALTDDQKLNAAISVLTTSVPKIITKYATMIRLLLKTKETQ